MFKKFVLIIISILIIITGCNKSQINEKGNFKQMEKINLKKPMSIMSLVFTDDKMAAFNQKDQTIYLLDFKGNIVDSYKKIGRGPGEYTSIRGVNLIGYSRYLYVIDGMTNKIMKFDAKSELKFVDEYYLKVSQVSPMGFVDNEENIYLSTMISDHVLLKINSDGKIVNKYIQKDKKDFNNMSAEGIKNYLVSNLYYPIISKNKMVLTGFLSKKLKFYKWENNRFKLIKETDIKGLNEDGYKSETKEGKNRRQVSIQGIGYIGSWIYQDKYLVGISKQNGSETFINCFDLKGNFLYNILLENDINKKYENMFYNEKNSYFYYQLSTRKTKEDDYNLDDRNIYIGKIENIN